MAQHIFGAGKLVVVPTVLVGGAAVVNPTPVEFGTLQDVQLTIKDDVKQLFGRFRDALAAGKGKRNITWKAKNANINGALLNALFFGGSYTINNIQNKVYDDATPSVIPSAAFAAPVATEAATTGGTLAAGAHYFTLVAYNHLGAAIAKSAQSTVLNTTTGTSQLRLTWGGAFPTGTVFFRAFYSQVSGTYTQAWANMLAANYPTSVTWAANWLAGLSAATIPSLTAGTIDATTITGETGTITFIRDLGVTDSAGKTYLRVASSPALDQYSVNETTGVYTFNTADIGNSVRVDFEYQIAKAGAIVGNSGSPVMGQQVEFEIHIAFKDEAGKAGLIVLPYCMADQLNIQTKLDDFAIPEISGIAYGKNGSPAISTMSFEALEGGLV